MLLSCLLALCLSACDSGPSGIRIGVDPYQLIVDIEPDTVETVTGQGTVSCTLTFNNTPLHNEEIHFRATSESSSNSSILSTSWTDTTEVTGLDPEVHYFPNNFPGDVDTIFAVYGDTTAWDYIIVYIHHP